MHFRGEAQVRQLLLIIGVCLFLPLTAPAVQNPPNSTPVIVVGGDRDSPNINSLAELEGKSVAVHRSVIMHDYFINNKFSGRLTLTDTPADALRQLAAGKTDYAVVAIVPGMYIIRELKLTNLIPAVRNVAIWLISRELRHPEAFDAIVTSDRSMLDIFSYVEAVAKSPQPLLITGESGAGKELIARAAHTLSGCRGKLVTVNVAGLDDTVFADTLFGHVRGSFTGAEQLRRGCSVSRSRRFPSV